MNPDIWRFILDHLSATERVILMVVVDVKGSSPGRTGFKMAVAENGDISGSIGGGVMEYNMVERARKMLSGNTRTISVKREVHQPDAAEDRSGLICSGEQTQAFIPLSNTDIALMSEIRYCLDKGGSGSVIITPAGLSFKANGEREEGISIRFVNEADWEYKELLGFRETLYIFGAGHVSLPLSQIMRMLDFRVVVYDDRQNLSTFISNVYAHEKKVIDYNTAGELVPEGNNVYAAIMSFGHKSDRLILGQLLKKKIRYLGMISSRSKVQSVFESLKNEGFTEKDFGRVDSPIGLPINSQTPAEIAVSIAAKIIQTKNAK